MLRQLLLHKASHLENGLAIGTAGRGPIKKLLDIDRKILNRAKKKDARLVKFLEQKLAK
ncbi:MAG: hypothetical protein Q8O87_01645 [bacterium]|nr:hypothetical protein [bacterium]